MPSHFPTSFIRLKRNRIVTFRKRFEEEATLEIGPPTIGGAKASDATRIATNENICGVPSVLYDAVTTAEGADRLLKNAAADYFVSHAFGHLKFMVWVGEAAPLLERAGVTELLDDVCIQFDKESVAEFIESCRRLRF
jgi:catalase